MTHTNSPVKVKLSQGHWQLIPTHPTDPKWGGNCSIAELTRILVSGSGGYDETKGVIRSPEEQEANVHRLAACWNACHGITTADLELFIKLGGFVSLPSMQGLK